jgi:6-O-methylguanine DNA methyltransferase, DNA binding domain
VTNTQPRVRINRQPLEQRSQFWPEAVSTKSGDRMKLVHVVLLRVLSHDRISHGSIHPISEWPATGPRRTRVVSKLEVVKVGIDDSIRFKGAAKNPVAFLVPCHRVVAKEARLHGRLAGRQRQRDKVRFGSKKRSAKVYAATDIVRTVSCLGAPHEKNTSAGPDPVRSSLRRGGFFAGEASSGAKPGANGLRLNLQLRRLHLLDGLRLIRSMRRPMHCRGSRV